MARRHEQFGRTSATALLEEAVHLLRLAPATALAAYYLGSLPFVLGVLYFWADMSRSASAEQRLVGASMGLAALFLWMKCWHGVFMGRLLAQLSGEPPPRWTVGRALRLVLIQAVIQPWGLFLLVLSAVAVVPLPWAYAFCQNACLLADGRAESTVGRTLSSAWHQATFGGKQNWAALLVMTLFALLVVTNIAQAILLPSWALKTLLGVDTVFSRGGFRVLNTTFLAITFGLAYLFLDPILKAFYTLRCFHGRSRRTGEDLRAELKHLLSAPKAAGVVLLAAAVLLAWPETARAGGAGGGGPSARRAGERGGAIPPDELDRSLRRVLGRRKYEWRMPREESKVKGFLDSIVQKLREWWAKLTKRPPREEPPERLERAAPPLRERHGGSAWLAVLQPIIYVLLGVGVVVLVVLLVQAYRKRGQSEKKTAAKSAAATPDVGDEDVTADELPESGWLDMARQLLEAGDRRLALRALYLASLARLAERGLILIARYKSNGDYRGELTRRAHAVPSLVSAFARNVRYFEDSWYGEHHVTDEIVHAFVANQKRIRGDDDG